MTTDLWDISRQLHDLRKLADAEGLPGLAYQIDLAAMLASDIAAPRPTGPVANEEKRIFVILSALRRLKRQAAIEPMLEMLIDQAIEEANVARNEVREPASKGL